MAKDKKESKKDQKHFQPEIQKSASGVLGGSLKAEDVVKQMAADYGLPPKEVKAALDEEISSQLAAQHEAGKEQQAKKQADEAERKKAEDIAKAATKKAEEEEEKARRARKDAEVKAAKAQGKVVVNVPKAYTLTLDNGEKIKIPAGPQSMPGAFARHWYSKAMGVEVVE